VSPYHTFGTNECENVIDKHINGIRLAIANCLEVLSIDGGTELLTECCFVGFNAATVRIPIASISNLLVSFHKGRRSPDRGSQLCDDFRSLLLYMCIPTHEHNVALVNVFSETPKALTLRRDYSNRSRNDCFRLVNCL